MPGMPYDTTRSLVFFQADLNGGVPLTTAFDVSPDLTKVRDTFFYLSSGTWTFRAPTSNNIPQTITIYPVPSTVQQAITWINSNAAASAPAPAPSPAYLFTSHPTLHLNNKVLVTDDTADFSTAAVTINTLSLNGNQISNVGDGLVPTSASTVKQLNSAVSTLNSTISSNKTATDASIATVSGKVDTILSGASTSLDTLKEISDYYSGLDSTQTLNLSNQVTYLTGLISTETSNRSGADTTLTTNLTAEIARATAAEASIMQSCEIEIKLLPVAGVVADSTLLPSVIPSSVKTNTSFTGHDGFYMKNLGTGDKFNYYLPGASILTGVSLANIIVDCTMVNVASPPIVTVYTQPTGSGDQASWYHAKASYAIDNTSALTAFKDYSLYTVSPPAYLEPGYTAVKLSLQPTPFSKGTISAADKILAISIGSNSAASAGQVEVVLSKAKVVTTGSVTWSYVFSDFLPEITATNASVSALTSTASTISSSLSAEVTRAQAAESTLTSSVQAEVSARTSAITTVQNSVSAEVSRATTAESTITSAATAVATRLTTLEAQVEQLYQVFYAVPRSTTL